MTNRILPFASIAALAGALGLCAPAQAESIDFEDHPVDIVNVPTNFVGCSGAFGQQLAADLQATHLTALVSASYVATPGLDGGQGVAVVRLTENDDPRDAAILNPLGIARQHAFGRWWEARKISINNHTYLVRGTVFTAHGYTAEAWKRNGKASVLLVNPERDDFLCPMESAGQEDPAESSLLSAFSRNDPAR